jgi:hypothetical protein
MIYYVLGLLIFIYALYSVSVEYNNNSGIKLLSSCNLFILLSILIILSGIRWETGTDWKPYASYFQKNNTWNEYRNTQFEILYAFLNFAVKTFSDSYTVFLLILGTSTILLKYASIKKIALYPALTFFLFYCFSIGDIFPVRQTLTISILFASVYFIHKRKKSPFVFLVIIAACFHLSAALWIFSYCIYHKRWSTTSIIILLSLSFTVGMFGSGIYIQILKTTAQFFGNFGKILNRVLVYLEGQYDDGSYSIVHNLLALAKRMIMIPIFLMFRKKMNIHSNYAAGLSNLYLFGNIFYLLFTMNRNFSPLQRMSTPFILLEIFLLPTILKIIKDKYMKFIYLNLLLLYGLSKLYSALSAYPEAYVPYKSIFG